MLGEGVTTMTAVAAVGGAGPVILHRCVTQLSRRYGSEFKKMNPGTRMMQRKNLTSTSKVLRNCERMVLEYGKT